MKVARKKYYIRLAVSLALIAAVTFVLWQMSGETMSPSIALLLWIVLSAVAFFIIGPGLILGRIFRIRDFHKKRIIAENYETWKRMNRKLLKEDERRMEKAYRDREKYGPWVWNGRRAQYERHNRVTGRVDTKFFSDPYD